MSNLPSSPPIASDPWLRPELVVPWRRIVEVIGVMLGLGIILGAFYSTRHSSGEYYQRFGDYFFIKNSAFESGFLALFLAFLYYHGWKPSDLRIRIGWLAGLGGVGLFLLTTLGVYLVNRATLLLVSDLNETILGRVLSLFAPTHVDVIPGSIHLHWLTLIGFVLLNAFYEELVYTGYVFNQWAQKYGVEKAIMFTAFLRLIVHTYQGTEHILTIGLWSLLFSTWYGYQRKVWPLIVAHFLIDLLSLGLFKIYYGASS